MGPYNRLNHAAVGSVGARRSAGCYLIELRARSLVLARFGARIEAHVPATTAIENPSRGRVVWAFEALYTPLRSYRDESGQHFGLLYDQNCVRDDECRSLFGLMLYLDDDFEGGATSVPEQGKPS